jgi:hypothetical protein
MTDGRPGLRPERLLRLARQAVDATGLDLDGANVLTEAATGAYSVTPVVAALGGAASVVAVTRESRHGTVADVTRETCALAELAGVVDRISIVTRLTDEQLAAADVVTNSGHLRPLDACFVSKMRPDAVVPLMFEAWEIDLGRDDVDLAALRARGIRYAGTNERHPAVDVFSYLAPMAAKLLNDAGVAVYGSRIVLLCDNPFMPYLRDGLGRIGAYVSVAPSVAGAELDDDVDAVVVALAPTEKDVISAIDVERIAARAPGALLAQFWGDVPRDACREARIACVPATEPGRGHMGILPSALGPEPIVRLQTGGLKVASVLRRPTASWSDDDRSYVDAC